MLVSCAAAAPATAFQVPLAQQAPPAAASAGRAGARRGTYRRQTVNEPRGHG